MAVLALAGAVLSGGIIPARGGQAPSSRPVRVLLAVQRDEAPVHASVSWRLVDGSRHVIARADPGAEWMMQREGGRVRAVGPSGEHSAWFEGPATLELSDTSGLLLWNARHFRGVLVYVPIDTALLVIDRLGVEDYLRGVVPLEAGTGLPAEHAAVEAQAVAARSFTYTRMLAAGARPYDLTASSTDQVFGGVDVETFIGDLAVDATAGWVLSYAGQVVNAPYHSTCGGNTAAPDEVWKTASVPYLQPVSDRIPGTDRFYCDIAPRFHWERALGADELTAAVERYARAYAPVPSGGGGWGARGCGGGDDAVGARERGLDRGGPRATADRGQRHAIRTARSRWRDPAQHVFFAAPGDRGQRAAGAAGNSWPGQRTRCGDVPVGRDRAGAGWPGLPGDSSGILSWRAAHARSLIR